MSERILLVEDDEALGRQIVQHLQGEGFTCVWWREGRVITAENLPEVALAILDLMVPKVPGLRVLESLRACSDTPVLILSGRDTTPDKVQALRLGADDYMTKPFWPEELIERVRARLRRPRLARQRGIEVGELRIDEDSRQATLLGTPVDLTPVEFAFLLALARKPGTAISRRWLLENVLDPERDGTERALDAHASRLRKKIGAGRIETVWGIGYRLRDPAAS